MAQDPAWAAPYIGLRYVNDARPATLAEAQRIGVYCWSLFALLQREQCGFEIADYDGPLWAGKKTVRDLGAAAREFADRFTTIPAGQEREGDAVLMRIFGQPGHIGFVTSPGRMLHIEEPGDGKPCDSMIEEYRGMKWERRIIAFHRAQPRS